MQTHTHTHTCTEEWIHMCAAMISCQTASLRRIPWVQYVLFKRQSHLTRLFLSTETEESPVFTVSSKHCILFRDSGQPNTTERNL